MITAARQKQNFDMPKSIDNQWCPGCGNFPILQTVKKVLQEKDIAPKDITFVSGIGQAAKLPQYIRCNYFNGLHGRALPVATGIKAANPQQTVIVTSGDGDVYGEGGNHLIHTIRRNPDITVIVHNNMIYGLTKGQASPTSEIGLITPVQPQGVYDEPINPLALAISLDAPFVARANAGDVHEMQDIIAQAIDHKGFSLVDIFQPCVVFNKVNTYQWFKEKTYYLENHDPTDKISAFTRSIEEEFFGLGVFYKNDKRKVFEESVGVYGVDKRPLHRRGINCSIRSALLASQK
ncbi:MAG: 2-oxoacid ferredoxin oxidoreductase [Candidatus Moraniibacteriota bacterium]|nr:MAG: 2-oxoacid ferredoxin oxidoreductase [Candidatus Moranbacteria bacterium]